MQVKEAPRVDGGPLLGSMRELLRDPLGAYVRARSQCGDVVRFTVGPPGLRRDFYGVFSASGVQQVIVTEASNFRKDNAIYAELRHYLGNGLLTSQDADHRRQRRLTQPLFTRRRVDGYAEAVIAEARALAARWSRAPGGVIDVKGEMHGFALRVVGTILFGADVEQAIEVVDRGLPLLNERARSRALSPLKVPRDWPTPGNRKAERARAELYELCDSIIAKRHSRDDADTDDLLARLVRAQSAEDGRLGRRELREQVLVFLLAGHDTTATALTFTLHLLSRHRAEQQRVRQELSAVLSGRMPETGDLAEMNRLGMVLKEAMRLYPPSPAFSRLSVGQTAIGGHRIPAGAPVFVSQWVTHRHPAYWPEPERFDPDRFTPEAEAARPRYAYFPFGGGARACVGQHFSTLHTLLSLAVLLQEFEFEDATVGDIPMGAGITLLAKGQIRARVRAVRDSRYSWL